MKENPVVSVLIITYQHYKYIKQCIESILSQKTSFRYEIIIGEDGSTDGTREVCQKYALENPDKIRFYTRSREDVIYLDGHATGRYNFIECFNTAKGKYIAICDGDDYWLKDDRLQKHYDFLENNTNYNACSTHYYEENESGKRILKPKNLNKQSFEVPEVIIDKPFHTSTLLIRNNFSLPDWFHTVFGADLFVAILSIKEKKLMLFNDITAVHRRTGTGLIKRTYKTRRNRKAILERKINSFREYDLYSEGVHHQFLRKFIRKLEINRTLKNTPNQLFENLVAIKIACKEKIMGRKIPKSVLKSSLLIPKYILRKIRFRSSTIE